MQKLVQTKNTIFRRKSGSLRNLLTSRPARGLALIILIVAAMAIGYKTYTHHQYVQEHYKEDKVAYSYLETHMKQVMAQVSATAGQPYEVNYSNGCSQSYIIFTKTNLGCFTGYRFSYEINNKEEGGELARRIFSTLEKNSLNGAVDHNDIDGSNNALHYTFEERYDRGCDFDYEVKDKDWHNEFLDGNYHKAVSTPYAAEFLYNCGGNVVKPVYALEKK